MQPFFFLLMSLKSSHSYKWNSLRLVFKVLLKRPALQRVPAASCVSILTQWLLWCNIAYGFCFCGCPPSELPSYIWGIPYHLNFSKKQHQSPTMEVKGSHTSPAPLAARIQVCDLSSVSWTCPPGILTQEISMQRNKQENREFILATAMSGFHARVACSIHLWQ